MAVFNIFRLCGDFSHLASFVILLHKIFVKKDCAGISLKTQILYFIVFVTRYLDIFTNFWSIYNTIMKVFSFFLSFLPLIFLFYFYLF